MYLRVISIIVEPVDVLKPTIWFVAGSYISAIAVIISLHSLIVAKAMFIIAMVKFGISMILFDRRIAWVTKYT